MMLQSKSPSDVAVVDDAANETNLSEQIVPMWRQRLRIFTHNKLAIISVAFIVALVLFCYLAMLPQLRPHLIQVRIVIARMKTQLIGS